MQSIASASSEITQTLLLDECVTRRLIIDPAVYAKFDISHSVEIKGLGWGAQDERIFSYLLKNTHFTLVTADWAFYRICKRENVKAIFCTDGKITFSETNEIVILGACLETAHRPPLCIHIKNRSSRLLRKLPHLVIRKITKIHARLQAQRLLTKSKCRICGMQCRSPGRLENHVKHDHKTSIVVYTATPAPKRHIEIGSGHQVIKPFGEKQIQALSLVWPKRIKPSYAGLLPIMPFERCVCGQFCYNKTKLRNHVISSHNAELNQRR